MLNLKVKNLKISDQTNTPLQTKMRLLPITRAVMLTIYFETVNDDSDGIALDYRCIPALIFKHIDCLFSKCLYPRWLGETRVCELCISCIVTYKQCLTKKTTQGDQVFCSGSYSESEWARIWTRVLLFTSPFLNHWARQRCLNLQY